MATITNTINPMHPARVEGMAGSFSVPYLPCIKFEKGELSYREAKQVWAMSTLDFHGLIETIKIKNEYNIGFTDAYKIARERGLLR